MIGKEDKQCICIEDGNRETFFIKGEIYTYKKIAPEGYQLRGKFNPKNTKFNPKNTSYRNPINVLWGLSQKDFDIHLMDLTTYREQQIVKVTE